MQTSKIVTVKNWLKLFNACISFPFLLFIFIQSCTKIELSKETNINKAEIANRFFNIPDAAPSPIKRIAADLQKQNLNKEFITELALKEGYPVWEKAYLQTRIHSKNNTLPNISAPANDGGGGSGDTIVIIPLAVTGENHIGAFIYGTVTDNISLRMFRQNDYIAFPFQGTGVATGITTAEDFALKMMIMDNQIFGTKDFVMKDKRLFSSSSNYSDTSNKQIIVQFGNSENTNSNGFTISSALQTLCVTITTTTTTNTCPYTGNCDGPNGTCDNCSLCTTSSTSYSMQCETWFEDGGGISGGWPVFSGGGGSGGGGGFGPPPCLLNNYLILSAIPEVCNPAPTPNIWPPAVDEHGYYFSRINELNAKLTLNPFALNPCDSLDAINTYGIMFQNIAQYSVPISVQLRIDSIKNVQSGWIVDNYNIQSLEEAYGPIVNCDFFPIKITQFPINTFTGNRMTPQEFLEYFRININQFITNPQTANFSCNFSSSFNDCQHWNLASENALGGLCNIYIPGNSGSVVLSDYSHFYSGYESHKFKFSTMENPFSNEHPVAGNREFGVYNSFSNPNEYTFYTMGVDRTWDWYTAVGNAAIGGFDIADQLWFNIQSNLTNFILTNGGTASLYSKAKYGARPKWDDVEDYLKKIITWEQLKVRLGC